MAIFKASYTRSAGTAKGNIRYIENRPGRNNEKITRTLYSWDGRIERSYAYELIDEAAAGSYFFRLVISPDPQHEDRDKNLSLS